MDVDIMQEMRGTDRGNYGDNEPRENPSDVPYQKHFTQTLFTNSCTFNEWIDHHITLIVSVNTNTLHISY